VYHKNQLLLLTIFFLLFFALQSFGQAKYTLSGNITDKETGEILIGASISVNKGSFGTSTNEYGYYSITLPEGTYNITISYIGLQSVDTNLVLNQNINLPFVLSADIITGEVLIVAGSNKEKVNSTQMGVEELSGKEIKEVPVVFGEADVLKVLQLKPGVKNGGEGTAGLFVRGGSADQNLFILDEAAVYNPTHLFGIFSTFNSDAINNVKLFKAGFPAEYGSKLSSVIDLRMKDGNKKRFSFSGGLGLISSRILLKDQ